MRPQINNYIEKSYNRLLDYAKYHSARAGIADEAADILDEVILSLLQMDECRLSKMLSVKKCQKNHEYTELDFFLLRMIKLNCYSETAPYRSKNKPFCVGTVNLSRLQIEDVVEPENDLPGLVFDRYEQVRAVINDLNLSKKAKTVFEFRFFCHESFNDWPGKENKKELYDIYKKVENMVIAKINRKTLI